MLKSIHSVLLLLSLSLMGGISCAVVAQVGEVVEPRVSFEILEAPVDLIPGNKPHLIFYQSDSCGCEVMALALDSADGEFLVVQDLYGDCWFNENKGMDRAKFENDTMLVWSELPFKATNISYPIVVEDGRLMVVEEIWYDPNDDVLAAMEQCFEDGDLICAMENYNAVQYPMSYLNYQEIGDRVLSIAYPRAQNACAQGFPAGAVEELAMWVDHFGYGVIAEYLPDRGDQEGMEERQLIALRALVDYAGYVSASGDTASTIDICTRLIGYKLDIPEPHRLMADIHFERGNYVAAKAGYLEYLKLMKRAGRQREVPSNVKKRSKYKTE